MSDDGSPSAPVRIAITSSIGSPNETTPSPSARMTNPVKSEVGRRAIVVVGEVVEVVTTATVVVLAELVVGEVELVDEDWTFSGMASDGSGAMPSSGAVHPKRAASRRHVHHLNAMISTPFHSHPRVLVAPGRRWPTHIGTYACPSPLPMDRSWARGTLGHGGDDLRLLAGEGGLPLEVRPCCADHSWWL